jgi:hypothetical protein
MTVTRAYALTLLRHGWARKGAAYVERGQRWQQVTDRKSGKVYEYCLGVDEAKGAKE